MKLIKLIFIFLVCSNSWAQTSSVTQLPQNGTEEGSANTDSNNDVIYVIGSKEKVFYTPGSAYFLDSKELEKFNYQDVNRILDKVPGVYIQEEDGIGLRPNIGLRGAHPHRSKKVSLLEDGILVGPAPYSAPAAYYFPSTSRIGSMEVFKGPSSVKYGPNSIGGAINMVTPKIRKNTIQNKVNYEGGLIHSATISHQANIKEKSWLIQGNYKNGNSFKEIEGTDDRPSISQSDFLLKYQYDLPNNRKISLKLSHATEDSEETYLGVSDDDYNANPYNRYSASALDRMQWDRQAIMVGWHSPLFNSSQYNLRVYHHQMNRNWNKFSRFRNNQDLDEVLYQNDSNDLLSVLNGRRNSLDETENLIIGENDRKYFSQGVQSEFTIPMTTGNLFHQVNLGLRIHRDQVSRNHSEIENQMLNGSLVAVEDTYQVTNKIEDTSTALSTFIQDEIILGDLTAKVGARFERIRSVRDTNVIGESDIIETQDIITPGVGVNYSLSKNIAILAGVNQGNTIVGPGQDASIGPEKAINYEAGVRIKAPFYFEAIGFLSDYSNIKGTCSFSAGCGEELIDQEFNGGEAQIIGVESIATKDFRIGNFILPISLNYTFTQAKFISSSTSDNPEWGIGEIRDGDPLPYVPQHSVNLGTGIRNQKYEFNLNVLWKSQMADQSVAENRKLIPSYGVIDTTIKYHYNQFTNLFLKVNNVLDNSYVVSYRPFGIRPGAPRLLRAGFNHTF